MMDLIEKQQVFVYRVAELVSWAWANGYKLTYGETWRTPEQAALNAKTGKGIKNSLHGERLAVDFNLFRGSKWLTRTEDFKPLGEYWESLSTPEAKCAWGGHFGDGNHFSIEHGGRK